MFSRRFSVCYFGSLVLVAVFGLTVGGCDSTELDPFRNKSRYYSVFGFLSDGEANHALRVIPIRRSPERIKTPHDPQAEIDAFVTTTDTLTGEVVIWNHVLTPLGDGSFGHIFRASFNVRAGRTYRLDITRNDGITTSAETTVPILSNARVERRPLIVDADSSIFQNIFLPDSNSPWGIEVVYYFAFSTPSRIAYGREGEAVEGEGWTFRINYARDMEQLAAIRATTVEELEWDAMGMKVLVLDKNWDPPQDIFDPEILAQPGALSNVENGYGYFGSIGLLQYDWPNSARFDSVFGFRH